MILAVDTSCYTTSMTVLDAASGAIVYESYVLLTVKPGTKGLRQSEGFYQHVYALNKAYEAFVRTHDARQIKAVACSDRPRNVAGSYMPVFEAGRLFCDNLALTLGVPHFKFSHQDGHIMAALRTSKIREIPSRFYAMHLSGGTTELVACTLEQATLSCQMVGHTLDIAFGQLVDRIGVEAGLAFPAGQALDDAAKKSVEKGHFNLKITDELTFNLSGFENKYKALLEEMPIEDVAGHLFNTIGHALLRWLLMLPTDDPVLIAGGVASNTVVRRIVGERHGVYFAAPQYAKDNALGIAELARQHYLR
ncbi:DNA-binding protein [Fusibacter sp. JL298sf-3]